MKENGNIVLRNIIEYCEENSTTIKAMIVIGGLIFGWIAWADASMNGMPEEMVRTMCALFIYPMLIGFSIVVYKIVHHIEVENKKELAKKVMESASKK